MFAKIWRWLKKLWQQLLGKPPQPSPRSAGTPGRVENQRLSDAEFESLFLQLLDRVEEGASRGNIKGFLIAKNIKEDELVAWLRRFGSKLLESPETHRKLARRMVQLGKVAGGELGDVAGKIGRELLGNSETKTSIVATSVIPTVNNQTTDTTNSGSVDIPVDVDGEAVEWFNRGVDEYYAGNIQAALGCFQKAIEISPNFHEAYNGLGIVRRDLGQYQQAIEAFQKAIEISPNYHYAYYGLGNVRSDLGQYQQAIDAYNRALEITHNQSWQAWANRGWAINNLHGYQAALRNWDEGLQSLQPETRDYQESCAVLHQFKGDAHYFYGKQQLNPHPYPYWRESRNSYITALKKLSGSQTSILGEVLVAQVSPHFQLLYLEILQDLAKVCNALNYQDNFQLCLDIGDTMLEQLLLETDSQDRKIQLANKFATFSQLRVVRLAQSSQLKEALLLAEKRKNLCLRWLRESRYVGILDETPLQYPEIEQFLSPGMAAIYWHYSPAAITTFIIKHNGIQIHLGEPPSPNPFPRNGGRGEGEDDSDSLTPFPLQREKGETETQTQTEETIYTLAPLPVAGRGWGWGSAAKQLQKFEDWLKEWKEDYQTNRQDAKNAKEEKESWRNKMADRLDELGKILDVEGILNKIGDDITQLILIPHRDFNLLPLHYLLREKDFTITYLPSLQIGIDLQTDTPSTPKKLLSIESPSRLEYAETESQIIAQLYDNLTWIKSSKATKNTVIAAFSNSADIFHFTGHGEHNLQQPLNSALELANKEMLTLQDIFQLNLKGYQLACLSACETGLTSKQGIIDEYVGLVSGFLAKGVTHVVTTLWQVGEIETALVMIKFHQLYKDNIPPALALQQTQTWLSTLTFADLIEWYRQESAKVEEGSGCSESLQGLIAKAQQEAQTKGMNHRPYVHPYYWAGFIVSGNQINCFGVGTRHN